MMQQTTYTRTKYNIGGLPWYSLAETRGSEVGLLLLFNSYL